jgi:hypothetical protein
MIRLNALYFLFAMKVRMHERQPVRAELDEA